MNEFTKNELEDLLNCVGLYTDGARLREHPYQSLLHKLQSLIDHYDEPKQIDGFVYHPQDYTGCNHKWEKLEQHPNVIPTIICPKCRAIHFIRAKHE